MARLEKSMNHIMNIVGNQPQANTAPNIAAYQPYQREHNRSNSESDELQRLKEENRLLKLAQRGPPQQQSQQFQNHTNYGSQDAFQERITNEMRRIQSRIDGFMRTYANRNNRQEQPRVRTREGRPVCDICGRVGHVRQNCYPRVDQQNQYHNPQNTQPRPQSGPRIAVLEAEGTAESKLLPNLSTKSRLILPHQLVVQTLKASTLSATPLLLVSKANMMLSAVKTLSPLLTVPRMTRQEMLSKTPEYKKQP